MQSNLNENNSRNKILLNSPSKAGSELSKRYDSAIKNAKELYIASAYLTNWSTKIRLSRNCENIFFLVGTDFGITRKKACSDVIKWLPKRFLGNFFAASQISNGGFHPKIITWKDFNNKFHYIIGSSNLTEAAFNSNYEANVSFLIKKEEFAEIKNWLEEIKDCQIIDNGWLNRYKEKSLKGGKSKKVLQVVNLLIPTGKRYKDAIEQRRRSEKTFGQLKTILKKEIIKCSKGKITNEFFWEIFWKLWSPHTSRMQGSGIQFAGKSANWKQACTALLKILEKSADLNFFNLDLLVKNEIDTLNKLKNPMRGAWFSEMLCHYFPNLYPLLNQPTKIYLKQNVWVHQRGLTEGGKYIDLAKKFRDIIKQNKNGPRNMPELDSVIWQWCKERGLLKN